MTEILFPESPRWRDGGIWFSDVYGNTVYSMEPEGNPDVEFTLDRPSGLGWLSDGTLIAAAMRERTLYQYRDGELSVFARLDHLTDYDINDLIVSKDDRIYVGTYGFDILAGEAPQPGQIITVDQNGESRIAADGLMFPNGMAIPPGENYLYVAETLGEKLTRFNLASDGELSEPTTAAELSGKSPDGICLCSSDAIWIASCFSGEFLKVSYQGEILQTIASRGAWALAPMLIGPDRQTLLLMSVDTDIDKIRKMEMTGFLDYTEAEFAGCGRP